ncbi:MAG: DUF6242 domain-containing protein [Bacteroides nordii]
MRIKFLSVIVSFLLVSFAMSSCLGDDDPIEYSPNALLQAFELDKVLGVNYQFTIDQLTGEIYNQDSLPVGSDTIINRILIKTMTVAGFVTIRNSANTEDSIFNIADSVNLVGTVEKPFRFKVWAPDMEHTREYALSVRVHQQQPDSLNWGKGPVGMFFAPGIRGKQKSIIFGDKIYVYASSTPSVYYTTLTNGKLGTDGIWDSSTINGLPSTNITSIVNFKSTLYVTTAADKKVYSSNDGINWEEAPTFGDNNVVLIAPIGNSLTGIKTLDNEDIFCTTTNGSNWTAEGRVPDNFPRDNISVTSFKNITGVPNIMIVGNIPEEKIDLKNDTATVAWGYMQGQEWAALDDSSYPCPLLKDPSIMYYGGAFYIFGRDFKTFYKSEAGIVWKEVTRMFMFPIDHEILTKDEEGNEKIEYYEGFRGEESDYSMVVDENNFIWIMRTYNTIPGTIANSGDVWRGKLNRLGFARQ